MVFHQKDYDKNIDMHDALIWTFRNNPSVLQNPNMYGWVQVDVSGKAEGVSCKVPISDQPMNDHAVVGTFSFKKAGYFLECADEMIRKSRKINNEYYLDVVLDESKTNGHNVIPFEIDKYIGWGTATDLEEYLSKS